MRTRLSDGVVSLRPLIPGDVDQFFEAARESVATVRAWLSWCHSVGNVASRRVAEKAGASYEGLLRRRLVTGERVDDAWMFSLIPEDLTPV